MDDLKLFSEGFLMEHKAEYIKKPKNLNQQDEDTCIICKIIKRDKEVPTYEIFRTEKVIIFLNLYPYTVGHLLISPIQHITGYEEFNSVLASEFHFLLQKSVIMLKHYGKTESLNVGWNQGNYSGGSIKHFHVHVVPRYHNDISFIDIISKTRPVIRSLENTQRDLLRYTEFLEGKSELINLDV
ncbi:MAG: HIT domain-containing protein [Candidatus Heimdallarchaeota archaeon]|nr:HIT domain-containing protein [Candidatus Heimdallarchaeota archaeon]MDH5644553.1 HIT domain-containing protein [Candidatus Heimdallarchaeota archaeon]